MKIDFKTIVDLYPYGASELRRSGHRSFALALGAAIFFQILLVGAWMGSRAMGKEEPRQVLITVINDPFTIEPPPPLGGVMPDGVTPVVDKRPENAVPVPIPAPLVPEGQTIPTLDELHVVRPPIATAAGDSLVISPDLLYAAGGEPDISAFVPVEVDPVPIKKVTPEYPQLAQEAEITGRVVVRALVGRDGRVKRAVALSGPEVLYEAAIAAAGQWVFKPAIQKEQPVEVWVTIPFNFRVRQ